MIDRDVDSVEGLCTRQQVIALGRLGWPLGRIEQETGVRRETASAYLKTAGIGVRPPSAWGRRPSAKPAKEVITGFGVGFPLVQSGSQSGVKITPAAWRTVRLKIAWIVAALFAVIAAGSLLIASRSGRGHKPLAFRQLNFRREAIFQAAFAGDTVVYSAATSGNTPQIFAVRSDYPEPQPIGPPGMTLLAVSSKGDLAVLVDAHDQRYRQFTGTLARMTLGGGAPREIQEGCDKPTGRPTDRSSSSSARSPARIGSNIQSGHVLREVTGSLSDVRFSPKGDRIAYFEHPRKLDDRGSVNTFDLSGSNTLLSEGYWSLRGLSWAPDGEEILFSASESGGSYTVYGVTMAGKRRTAYQSPGGFTIQDVARDGRSISRSGAGLSSKSWRQRIAPDFSP